MMQVGLISTQLCHHHIYDSVRFPYVPEDTRNQSPATVDVYRLLQKRLGLTRNVIVTPSAYGFDNSCTQRPPFRKSKVKVLVVDGKCHSKLNNMFVEENSMNTIIDQFRTIPATCVSDAMQGLNNLDPAIKPLKEEYKITGRVCTVKMPAGDNMTVLKAIRQAKPGDILVVDVKGYPYSAAAGDFVIGLAHTLGLGGVVIDGTIRDVISIKNLNFPVFCKGATVACSKKYGVGEVNVPISCGGISIQPGDIIVGDADGVVVVPQSKEETVAKDAILKLYKDQERAEAILGNPQAAEKYIDNLLPDSCK